MHSHVQTEGASVLRSSPLKRCRKCVLLSQYQGSLQFSPGVKSEAQTISLSLLYVYMLNRMSAEYGSASKDIWRTLGPWTTNTALASQESHCHQEALCQPLSGNSFPYTKSSLSLWKIIQMMLIVCGARNSSGDLMVVTAHRRSAFNLVIKVSENSMYGWC